MNVYTKGKQSRTVVFRCLASTLMALAAVFAVCQAQTTANYSFTLNGDTASLTDAIIIDVQPDEADATVTLINGTYTPNGGQPSLTGTLTGYGPQYLVLMGVFTDKSGNQGVAVSMPVWLGSSTILNGSWDTFNSSTNFPFGLLPTEAQTMGDLEIHTQFSVSSIAYPAYNYLNGSANVLTAPFIGGEIVDFDGPTFGGIFYYSVVPEPASAAMVASSLLFLAFRRRQNA